MKNNGVIIFFLRMYSLNIYCLDFLKKEGGYVILENWNEVPEYTDTILFSINDDFPESLNQVFQNMRTGMDGTMEWKKKGVKGKAKIIWGDVVSPSE